MAEFVYHPGRVNCVLRDSLAIAAKMGTKGQGCLSAEGLARMICIACLPFHREYWRPPRFWGPFGRFQEYSFFCQLFFGRFVMRRLSRGYAGIIFTARAKNVRKKSAEGRQKPRELRRFEELLAETVPDHLSSWVRDACSNNFQGD